MKTGLQRAGFHMPVVSRDWIRGTLRTNTGLGKMGDPGELDRSGSGGWDRSPIPVGSGENMRGRNQGRGEKVLWVVCTACKGAEKWGSGQRTRG